MCSVSGAVLSGDRVIGLLGARLIGIERLKRKRQCNALLKCEIKIVIVIEKKREEKGRKTFSMAIFLYIKTNNNRLQH